MRKRLLTYALLLGLSPLLVQCVASEQDLRGIDLRTRTLDNRVSELERLNETVRGQAAAQARLGNELDGINTRLLQYQGRMDEADHQRARLREEQEENQRNLSIRLDNIDITLREIKERLEGQRQSFAAALAELEELQADNRRQIQEVKEQRAREAAERAAAAAAAARAAEQARREAEERARREAEERARQEAAERARQAAVPVGGPREISPEPFKQKPGEGQAGDAAAEQPSTPARTAAPAPPAPAPQPAPAPASAAATGTDLFNQGRQKLEAGAYQEAYTLLGRHLEAHPRGERAADARFLLGESLYGQEEYELAILEYQKVIADFPGHARIPEALLRQGMAFEALREPSTAAIIYERLAGEFPRSPQADQARQKLQQLR